MQFSSYTLLPMVANRRELLSSFSPHKDALQRNRQPIDIFIDFSQNNSMITVSRPCAFSPRLALDTAFAKCPTGPALNAYVNAQVLVAEYAADSHPDNIPTGNSYPICEKTQYLSNGGNGQAWC
jgi:hypothetical protein